MNTTDLTSAEQLAAFRAAWCAANPDLAGQIDPTPPPPPAPRRKQTRKRQSGPPTKAEHVLEAARGFDGRPFGFTALAIACWRAQREAFGLAGCKTIHPDTRRISEVVYGKRGLLRQGLLRKVGTLFEVVEVSEP